MTVMRVKTFGLKGTPRRDDQLSESQRDNLARAANLIESGFTWANTVEGYDFWWTVYHRLVRMSEGEALQ